MKGLESLLAFTETAKRGNFAAAARMLGSSPSTLAKAVARLESNLGLRLFHRTTRRVTLTPDGERLYERCLKVVDDLDAIHIEASGARAAPSGTLRVDLPIVFGRKLIMPLLAAMATEHRDLKLDVRLSDAYVDLVKDGIDLAVRIGELQDSNLVARRFGSQDWILCASPDYIARHGAPGTVPDLDSHEAVLFRMPTTGLDQAWKFLVGRRDVSYRPASRFRFSDGETMTQVVSMGLGLAQLPDYIVYEQIAAGTLVEVLPQLRPRSTPISAVIPANRLVPARVRAVLDALESLPLAHAQARRHTR
jgi:LysR family transcriptional regulator, regulator for bpeEF and oprC